MKGVESLRVWQEAIVFVEFIYTITKPFPKEERYGITQQLQRAAVSIPTNIAEAYGRYTYADKAHFLVIARGSSGECKTLLIVSQRIGLLSKEIAKQGIEQAESIGKMLSKLISTLRSAPTTSEEPITNNQ